MSQLAELDAAEMWAGWHDIEARRIGDCLIINGDSADVLPMLGDGCVDAVVTDPPYGLSREPDMQEVLAKWITGEDYAHNASGFMGKTWDSFVPGPAMWAEAVRTMRPGAHLLAFAGSRTYDLMAVAIRLADMEIRDQLMWLYGTGFPKSHDVSKAIDKAAGAERTVVGVAGRSAPGGGISTAGLRGGDYYATTPATDDAQRWDGWGTALKPAHEPVVMARKPLDGTVAANVLTHGTGAINIGGCRVGSEAAGGGGAGAGGNTWNEDNCGLTKGGEARPKVGRHPANVLHDGAVEFPGDAARFFYSAKAAGWERDFGLAGIDTRHPTVKPIALMQYLIRLVTPPGGVVLDPFVGSGTTGIAAALEGRPFIGIEQSPEYFEMACARVAAAVSGTDALRARLTKKGTR